MAKVVEQEESDSMRVNLYLDTKVVERLDVLAKHLRWSRNQVIEWLLTHSTSDVEYVLNCFAATVRGALRKGG